MAQETLNIVITADNKEAITSINQTIQSANALGESLKKMPDVTNRATQSLTNLSRIAQDAPYGFIGIANNLNPMLESFQRLQTEAGSSGNALKAMVSGLMGPAGIGLALGVVSSLLVKFGGDIADFTNNLINGNNSIKEYADSLHTSQKAYIEAYTEVYKLGKSFEDFHNGLKTQKEVLNEYNNTLGKTYGKTNDITEAENIWAKNSENFIQAAVLRAASLDQIAKAAKKSSEAFETAQKPKEEFTSILSFGGAGMGGASAINLQSQLDKQRKASQAETVADIKKEEQFHLDVNKAIQEKLKLLKEEAVYSKYIGQELPKEIKAKKEKEPFDWQTAIKKRTVDIGMDNPVEPGVDTAIKDAEKKHEEYLKWLTNWTKSKQKLSKDNYKEEQKDIEKFAEQYSRALEGIATDLAISLSASIGKLFSGEGGLKEAMNGFLSILAEGLISVGKLAIATGIAIGGIKEALKTLNPVVAIAAGVALVALGAYVKSSLAKSADSMGGKTPKMAEGGVVTGPTYALIGEGNEHEAVMPLSKLGHMMKNTFNAGAMQGNQGGGNGGQFVLKGNDLVLALQRSNYNLNLRRG